MAGIRKTISVLIGGVNTFFPKELMKGIEMQSKKQDVNVLFFLGSQTEDFYEAVLNIKCNQSYDYQFNTIYDYSLLSGTDGFILNYGTVGVYLKNNNLLRFAAKYDAKPIVLLTDYAKDSPYPSVMADNYQGMYDLVSHLIEEHNCKKVLHLAGPQGNLDAKERLRGYIDACKAHGMCVDDKMIVEGDFSEFVIDEVERLLDDNEDADAIAFANDEMSFAGYRVCKKRGLEIGKDILFTGFDDCAMAKEMNPPLTTVFQDGLKMGSIAVDTLLSVAEGANAGNIRVPVTASYRQSCGCDEKVNLPSANQNYDDVEKKLREAQQIIREMKLAGIEDVRKSWFIPFFVRELDEFAGNDRDFCYKVMEGMKSSHSGDSYLFLFDTPLVCYDETQWELVEDLKLAAYYKNDECFAYETFERPIIGKKSMMDFMGENGRHSYLMFLLFSGAVQYGIIACEVALSEFPFYYMLSLQLGISFGYHEGRKVELAYRNKLMSDMEEILEEKQQLVVASGLDSLTGVYNRRGLFLQADKLFEKMANDAINNDENSETKRLHLIFADLDHLKQINDNFGHSEGDFAIKSCADILRSILRGGDIIARLGGDEFVCLVLAGGDNFEKSFSFRRAKALERLNRESNKPYYIEFSYGIYSGEIYDRDDLEYAIGKADACLYESKKQRKDNVIRK